MSAPEHPNAARVAEFYAAMEAAADEEAAQAMMVDAFAEDAVWCHLGGCHHAATYEGRHAIISELMAAMVQDSAGSWAPTLVHVRAMGDELVLAHMTESAQIAGEHHERGECVAEEKRGRQMQSIEGTQHRIAMSQATSCTARSRGIRSRSPTTARASARTGLPALRAARRTSILPSSLLTKGCSLCRCSHSPSASVSGSRRTNFMRALESR
jgi:uncharacterized protein (TIGR02246 family)